MGRKCSFFDYTLKKAHAITDNVTIKKVIVITLNVTLEKKVNVITANVIVILKKN